MKEADSEDVILWPDGYWCYRYELEQHGYRSDDYEVIPFGNERWCDLVES